MNIEPRERREGGTTRIRTYVRGKKNAFKNPKIHTAVMNALRMYIPGTPGYHERARVDYFGNSRRAQDGFNPAVFDTDILPTLYCLLASVPGMHQE